MLEVDRGARKGCTPRMLRVTWWPAKAPNGTLRRDVGSQGVGGDRDGVKRTYVPGMNPEPDERGCEGLAARAHARTWRC